MQSKAKTVQEYLDELPEDRKVSFNKLRETIIQNLPKGFEECIGYGMIGYVVPHSIYPNGYHCDSKVPLPFANIATQKNFIALYLSAFYVDSEILDWFKTEYPKHCKLKLDMGKCCVRFKKPDQIPFDLIAQLMQKMTVDEWIKFYESRIKK